MTGHKWSSGAVDCWPVDGFACYGIATFAMYLTLLHRVH